MSFHAELDTRRDHCPVPVIRAHLAMKELAPSQVLRVLAGEYSDRNFAAFARSARYRVIQMQELDQGGVEILLEKTPYH